LGLPPEEEDMVLAAMGAQAIESSAAD